MYIYLIMFVISSLCLFLSYKCKEKQRILKNIFIIIAVLVPSIIAGCRSLSIGTDIRVYGKYVFLIASKSSIVDYFSIIGFSDILYYIFTFIVAKLFKNIHFYLFLIQLINCTVIYKAISLHKDKLPIWLSYLLFLFTIYFRQLNLLRQGLAISFSLLAVSYLLKEDQKKYWLFTFISVLFHSSAIVTVLLFIIKKLCERKKDRKILIVTIYTILILILVFFLPILKFITGSGLLPQKYTYAYFTRYLNINNEIDTLGTVFKLFWCMIAWLVSCKKGLKDRFSHFDFFFHLIFIDLILWMLNIHIFYMDRISFYFGYVYMLFFVPTLFKLFKKDNVNKTFSYILILGLFAFYWYVRFIYQNAGEIFPYVHF